MADLRSIVLEARSTTKSGGGCIAIAKFYEAYLADAIHAGQLQRKLKVAAVCGNGTAGAFAPKVLSTMAVTLSKLIANLITVFLTTILIRRI
jgi:phosphomannomutase / phosphoglucomutase